MVVESKDMHSQVAGQRGNTALQSQFIDIKVTDASRKVHMWEE